MKNNFIELTTTEGQKVLINLGTVIEIAQDKNYTTLYTNCPKGSGVTIITVTETYEDIKKHIGLGEKGTGFW